MKVKKIRPPYNTFNELKIHNNSNSEISETFFSGNNEFQSFPNPQIPSNLEHYTSSISSLTKDHFYDFNQDCVYDSNSKNKIDNNKEFDESNCFSICFKTKNIRNSSNHALIEENQKKQSKNCNIF